MDRISRNFGILLVILVIILGAVALWQNQQPSRGGGKIVCTLEAKAGLTITLKDEQKNPITNASITADKDGTSFLEIDTSSGNYSGLYERDGQHSFTINKIGYQSYTGNVNIPKDQCHVIPQHLDITLKTNSQS